MDNKYKGMTVNERLYVSGLLQEFDNAVEKKDVGKVISLLKKVEMVDTSINPVLEGLGLSEDNINS